MKKKYFIFVFLSITLITRAEDGYRLWLRYDKIDDAILLKEYRNDIAGIQFVSNSATLDVAKQELLNDLSSLLDKRFTDQKTIADKFIVAGTPLTSPNIK